LLNSVFLIPDFEAAKRRANFGLEFTIQRVPIRMSVNQTGRAATESPNLSRNLSPGLFLPWSKSGKAD